MEYVFVDSINHIPADEWDRLWNIQYPFLKHSFLALLENSKSVCSETGWQPSHLVFRHAGQLVAAMPLYLKAHSYGEYVFDWAWADAYSRNGYHYYPKLLNAIPFTPVTGPRWVAKNERYAEALFSAVREKIENTHLSGFHSLFSQIAVNHFSFRVAHRKGCQYHWFNQDFMNFDEFLELFSSRKRKAIKKERQKISDNGIELRWISGGNVTIQDCQQFYELYKTTYEKKSGHEGYLTEAFFHQLPNLNDHLLFVFAYKNNSLVAGSLYFYDDKTLYGRYWGAHENFDSLHFECCYYQGIEFAISQGLRRFDAGAQGEHKIARGFIPVLTNSYHWLLENEFQIAIQLFTQDESQHINAYCQQARGHLPFKADIPLPPLELSNATLNTT